MRTPRERAIREVGGLLIIQRMTMMATAGKVKGHLGFILNVQNHWLEFDHLKSNTQLDFFMGSNVMLIN